MKPAENNTLEQLEIFREPSLRALEIKVPVSRPAVLAKGFNLNARFDRWLGQIDK